MDLIFEFLPADRGYLLLEQADGSLTLSDLAFQDEEAPDLRRLDAVLADDRGHGRQAEGRDPDLGRADRPALRERRLDPPAADPLGDVRSALERLGGDRGHLRRFAAARRELLGAGPRPAGGALQLRGRRDRAGPAPRPRRRGEAHPRPARALPLAAGHRGDHHGGGSDRGSGRRRRRSSRSSSPTSWASPAGRRRCGPTSSPGC